MPRMPAAKAAAKKAPAKAPEAAATPDPPTPEPEAQPEATKAAEKLAPRRPAAPKQGILASAKSLSDQRVIINGLFQGDPGTGKTTDVAHMANLGKVIFVNAEGGLEKGPLAAMGVNVDNILVLPEDPEDLSHKYLEDLGWELKGALAKDPDAYAGVIWDSITDIHARLVKNVRDHQNAKAIAAGSSRMKGNEAGDILDRFFTDISDYGVMTSQMRELLPFYRDLPCHFAVTCLQRRDKDDDGKVVYRPAVTPALAGDLQGYVKTIGITEAVEIDGVELYRALFRPFGKYRGKDRLGVLPRRLYDPTFDRIVAYANGELTVDNDPVMLQVAELAKTAGLVKAEREDEIEDETEPEEEATE